MRFFFGAPRTVLVRGDVAGYFFGLILYDWTCTFIALVLAFVAWYAVATSFSPLSSAARAALAVTVMAAERASHMTVRCSSSSSTVYMVDSPVGYAQGAHLKFSTFLVVGDWICGISVIPFRHRSVRCVGTFRAGFPPAERFCCCLVVDFCSFCCYLI